MARLEVMLNSRSRSPCGMLGSGSCGSVGDGVVLSPEGGDQVAEAAAIFVGNPDMHNPRYRACSGRSVSRLLMAFEKLPRILLGSSHPPNLRDWGASERCFLTHMVAILPHASMNGANVKPFPFNTFSRALVCCSFSVSAM